MPAPLSNNNLKANRAGTLTSPQVTQHHRWRCVFLLFCLSLPASFVRQDEVMAKLVKDYNQHPYLSSRENPLDTWYGASIFPLPA
jgi:hypothetical protein